MRREVASVAWVVSSAIALLLLGSIRHDRHEPRIPCPREVRRVFVDVQSSSDRHIDGFCGDDVRPSARLTQNLNGVVGTMTYDRAGHLYVPLGTGTLNGIGYLNIYDRDGNLAATVDNLENVRELIVNEATRTVFADVAHYEDPTQPWKSRMGWISSLVPISMASLKRSAPFQFPGMPEGPIARFDHAGIMYYTDGDNGRLYRFDLRKHRILGSTFAPAERMETLGDTLFVYGIRTVCVFRAHDLKLMREFRHGAKDFQDVGPMAVAPDGTLYLVHNETGSLEIYAPGASRPSIVLRNLHYVYAITVDNDKTLFVERIFQSSTEVAGVYVYAPNSDKVVRVLEKGSGAIDQTIYGITVMPPSMSPH